MPEGKATPRFIVAFSGGLDSTVLLHTALMFFGPEALLVAHVNHGLQAAASAFERHARQVCRTAGLKLKVLSLKGAPAKGESVEAWARQARYEALSGLARREHIAHIMTAHHQDDQIETLLIALSRGAGLEGLSGIAQQRSLRAVKPGSQTDSGSGPGRGDDLTLHRPLLDCTRAEIEAHAQAYDLSWVEDPSNADTVFLRNRIRREVLPVLRRAMPGFERQAARSQSLVAEAVTAMRLMDQQTPVSGGAARVVRSAPAHIVLRRNELALMEPAGRARALRHWLAEHGLRAPSKARLDDVGRQLLSQQVTSLRMPFQGMDIRRERDECWIQARSQSGESARADARASETRVPEARVPDVPRSESAHVGTTSGYPGPGLSRTRSGWLWRVPEFAGVLVIQSRLAGAHSDPAGLSALRLVRPASTQKMLIQAGRPRRSLKNLFQEAGISAAQRKCLPCVMRGEDLLYVPGLGVSPESPWTFHFLPDL